jgi:hypothetical protein
VQEVAKDQMELSDEFVGILEQMMSHRSRPTKRNGKSSESHD